MKTTLKRAHEHNYQRAPANRSGELGQHRVAASRRTADQPKPLTDSQSWRDMTTGQIVRWVLSTYELPERLEKRLTWIAVTRLQELFLTRFDDQYRYIDGLVDRFTRRNRDWRAVSLDAPVYEDNCRALQDIIPGPSGPFRGFEPDRGVVCWTAGAGCGEAPAQRPKCPGEPRGGMDDSGPGEHQCALTTLKDRLDPAQYEFVEHLLRNSQGNGCVCEAPVARNLAEIQSRIDELAERYQVDDKIAFPPKPILDIRFHPLRIRFGRRPNISENPLRYWRRHRHIYRGLRRKELFYIDQGLYQALRAAGQLDQAIPETYRRKTTNRKQKSTCSREPSALASRPAC